MKPDRIIQLEEKDYHKLVTSATLNNEEIEKRAIEMWKEKGSYALVIEIKFNMGSSCDSFYDTDKFRFESYSYVKDWGDSGKDKFPISEVQKRSAIKYANNRLNNLAQSKFGDLITFTNDLRKAKIDYNHKIYKYNAIMIVGWIVALICVIIHLFEK
ncbi:MAG: hypothetical protein RR346_04930 [Bacteroidales bacterium]